MRDVNLQQQPVFYPNVCVRCGCGTGQREYFIDLGLDLSKLFDPLHEGNVYYCNECAKNLVTDLNRIIAKWDAEHSPWESELRVSSTYSWSDGGSGPITVNADTNDSDAESNDSTTESSEPDVAESVAVPEPAVHDVSTDESERDSGLAIGFG